jgi:uncharacterized protein
MQSRSGTAAPADAVEPSAASPASIAAAPAALVAPVAPPEPAQLNGLALIWAVFKDWLRSLFAPKKT